MSARRQWIVFVMSAGAYVLCAAAPWHDSESVRRAGGITLATLILWISEIAPLGVVALVIPIAATFAGLLSWREAIASWGSDIIFLFLGAFLLARALEKHGAFDWVLTASWARGRRDGPGAVQILAILLIAGLLSVVQSNTAVTAMMLPVVIALSKRTPGPAPVLLALAWGATFGGLATPVGTAPNFIGYARMKEIDPNVSFVSWLRVGVPVWLGCLALGWCILRLARRWAPRDYVRGVVVDGIRSAGSHEAIEPVGGSGISGEAGEHRAASRTAGRAWALGALGLAALLWLVPGAVLSSQPPEHPTAIWIRTYLPESLVPVALALVLFVVRVGPEREPVLDRSDFQSLDWDTLFLIAGGLALGRMMKTSGFDEVVAQAIGGADLPPLVLRLGVVGVTVLLSELTSNTATANLMVPMAASLAGALALPAVHAIWLVAMAASLGFALPVSTPPNAIVFGTRQIPLRFMAAWGLVVNILCSIWLVLCMGWLA